MKKYTLQYKYDGKLWTKEERHENVKTAWGRFKEWCSIKELEPVPIILTFDGEFKQFSDN